MKKFSFPLNKNILKLSLLNFGPMIKNSFMFRAIIITIIILVIKAPYIIAQPSDARVIISAEVLGMVTGEFFVSLPDSTSFSEIDTQLFDTLEDTLIFERTFVFDQSTGLPAGISWTRQGTDVFLGIGTFSNRVAWLGKVRLKSNSGQWSDWYEFLFSQ